MPSRPWDELLADVRQRGSIVQRRSRFEHSALIVAGAVAAVVLPLSPVLFHRGPAPVVPPVTQHDLRRVVPSRPIIAAPGAPLPGGAAPGGAARGGPVALGAPPVEGPSTLQRVVTQLFSDPAGDVTNNAGQATSEPAIDLRGGAVAYDGDQLTFSIVVTDLSATKAADLCDAYLETLTYRGVEMYFSAVRGASACGPGFAFSVAQGSQQSTAVAIAGRFDDATNTILGTISLAELNRVLPATWAGAAIPRITSSSRFDGVTSSAQVYKKIGPTATTSDPRNAHDGASG